MKQLSALVPALLFSAFSANAQYCTPSFLNGCFNWNTMAVSMGTVAWTPAGDCSMSDQTATVISIVAGEATPVSVENGAWCGCAVWVDLDNSGSFEDTENLYTIYVGGSPSYIYDFDLTIPPGTLTGSYRMRIISPWGSDGVTPGDNGYGPCGAYQYGNFEDFTLDVTGVSAIGTLNSGKAGTTASPNPATGLVTLKRDGGFSPKDRISVMGIDGSLLREWNATAGKTMDIDLGSMPAGTYFVRNSADAGMQPLRLVKQ